ncbi:MAG TPA: class I SAM-dependent methyltransferase [Candidatus Limnocylindrales bacterium]|nr:class I SAM-dependent methyltransferase [Candidatus Limnocylindrales bacterium]
MAGIVNWEEIREIITPPRTLDVMKGKGGNTFDDDNLANMYDQMAKMEKSYTLNQVNAFETNENDTVLDVGCGPGRIAVPLAQRARTVTALDQSEKMLAHCIRNARAAGIKNLNPLLLDWKDAVLGKNLEQHDIVIASRSIGIYDIKKLSRFARKYVVIISWANAPYIPMILNELFAGVESVRTFPLMPIDRRIGYNISYNMVYDLGYDPNIKIVLDGFTKDFASREEAYADLWKLQGVTPEIPPVFKKNVDNFLSENNSGGITFRRETKSFVMWWVPGTSA